MDAPGIATRLRQRTSGETSVGGLQIENLVKVYAGGVRANDGLTFDARPGEVYGLLGPNGAGKSTLVRQIIGMLSPTSGTIRLGEMDLVADPARARRLSSYLAQGPVPIDSLRASEAVELVGRMRGGRRQEIEARRKELFEALAISAWSRDFGASLSGGVRRLVGFAMAAIRLPPLIILDEPTNDVDPMRRRLLWEQIRIQGEYGCTVLLVTHNVLEAERAVDRLAIMDRGRILASGTPAELKAAVRWPLQLELTLSRSGLAPAIPPYVHLIAVTRRRLRAAFDESDTTRTVAWVRSLVERRDVEDFQLGTAGLEDAYAQVVKPDAEEEDGDRTNARQAHLGG